MSRDNPLWGSERIRGELLKLGIVVSKRSIRRYRWRKPTPVGTQSWRTFLANELRGMWAADLLVVQTINYRVVYVLFFITHDRRELLHFNVTSNPTAAWIWQQVVEATPWGRRPDYLIHDRDAVYGRDFGARLSKLGITTTEAWRWIWRWRSHCSMVGSHRAHAFPTAWGSEKTSRDWQGGHLHNRLPRRRRSIP
jgi:hypothetical protein